ncbi:Aspartate/glutamate/uridylate kinase [Corchorus olitorius]|uniref:UMP kinase n=1 Tax=Corchorus olitorius TaxID=93759 RepID=A0A1R3GN98_9ROSI|nr:Aspartate/glutamate/uridylate kinase [Corchorus olitorius]
MSSQDNLPLIDAHAPSTRHPSSPTENSATLGGDSGFLSNPDSEPETRRKKPRFESEYRKDREEWSDTAIACLLEAYTEKFNQLNRGSSSIGKTLEGEDRNGGSSLGKQANKRYVPNNVASGSNLKSKSIPSVKWRRVVFKISGTALSGNCQSVDPKIAMQIAREIATACRLGVQVAIVVGGRNFFCGDSWVSATGFDRPTAYQIGMMASVMNSMLLQSALEKLGVQTRMQSAFVLPEVAEPYSRPRAIRHLEKGKVVIFGGIGAGTGNPLFTTDTAAALRATESTTLLHSF